MEHILSYNKQVTGFDYGLFREAILFMFLNSGGDQSRARTTLWGFFFSRTNHSHSVCKRCTKNVVWLNDLTVLNCTVSKTFGHVIHVDARVLQRRHSPIMWSVLVYVVSPVLVRRWCIGGEGGTVLCYNNYTVLGNTCRVCALCLPQ